MKRYLAVLIVISICMFMPMHTRASQSAIETMVPTTHTVAIEAEHASALYVEGDKGLSNAYPVPRFSKPQFKITAEDGYTIKRVLLNGEDVTKKIKKETLKLSEVCENQVIKIETEAISQETPQTPQAPQTTQDSEEVEETVQNQETGELLPETKPSKAENEPDGSDTEKEQEAAGNTQEVANTEEQQEETDTENQQEQEEIGQTTSEDGIPQILPENEKHFIRWIVVLLLAAGISAGFIFLIIKRKSDKK